MRGITISDSTNDGLTVDLIDILRLLGLPAEESDWELSEVEAVGDSAAGELHTLAEGKARVPGRTLLRLAAAVTQVIDGTFAGYRNGAERPWIVIRAVDSSAYDVQSQDEELLDSMRNLFKEVSDLPE